MRRGTHSSFSRGYIALISVLLTSALLLGMVAASSLEALFARDSVMDESSYETARRAAWSCASYALNRISVDSERFTNAYGEHLHASGTQISLVGSANCTILSASTSQTLATIHTQGHTSQGTAQKYVSLYVEAWRASSTASFNVQSWELR